MLNSEKLCVALIQFEIFWENIDANLQQLSTKINAISNKVDLILLPEMFTTGFTMNAQNLAEKMNGKTVRWMQKVASEKQAVVSGSIIISENDTFYNRLLFVHPLGKVDSYDKRHTFTLAKEHEVFSKGKENKIFEVNGWKICPQVCYDLRFPVWSRNVENYDVLFYVASWPEKRISAWDTLLKARAIENMSYTLGVNRIGKDNNNFNYVGHSVAYDFLGNLLSEEKNEKETIILVLLDKKKQEETRKKLSFLNDKDTFELKKV